MTGLPSILKLGERGKEVGVIITSIKQYFPLSKGVDRGVNFLRYSLHPEYERYFYMIKN